MAPHLVRYLVVPLHVAFLVGLLLLFRRLRRSDPQMNRPAGSTERVLVGGVGLLFLGLVLYQASWQVFGFLHPEFMQVVRRYDTRMPGIAACYRRGTIVDRRGAVLAESVRSHGGFDRRYPEGPAACHLVGYDDRIYGRSGVEAARERYLMGRSLGSPVELLRILTNGLHHRRIRGNTLELTLDAGLQRIAWSLLARRPGAILLMDIQRGDLLVSCSGPAFDPNQVGSDRFRHGLKDPAAPMLNRAFGGLYPPGSTLKILLAALSAERGFQGHFLCPPEGYRPSPGARAIRDHEALEAAEAGRRWDGHGTLGLERALEVSSNTFFAQLGVAFGQEGIREAWEAFALDRPAEVLPAGTVGPGLVAPACRLPEIPADALDRIALISIGQGDVLVTPLQMALLVSGIAGGGRLPEPRLSRRDPPRLRTRALEEAEARRVAQALRGVVESGTARRLADLPFATSGKTGTAETPSGRSHSWFVGFAPSQEPRVAISVVLEHAGTGARAAVPAARALLLAASEAGYLAREGSP